MRVAAAVSLRRASVPPAKTRSMLPMVTTSPSCSIADSTRVPLTNVPLMLRLSRISVPLGVGIRVAWWREASTSGMTMSLSLARPILMAPRRHGLRAPLCPAAGSSACSSRGFRASSRSRAGPAANRAAVGVGDDRSICGCGLRSGWAASVRGAGAGVPRLRARSVRAPRASGRSGGMPRLLRGSGPGRALALVCCERWGPVRGRPPASHVRLRRGRPTEPWWRPTSKVSAGPSGLPILMRCPSWMSTVGTRWLLTNSPLRLPLSMATQRPWSKRSSRCAREIRGWAMRTSARRSRPMTTSLPAAKVRAAPSYRTVSAGGAGHGTSQPTLSAPMPPAEAVRQICVTGRLLRGLTDLCAPGYLHSKPCPARDNWLSGLRSVRVRCPG